MKFLNCELGFSEVLEAISSEPAGRAFTTGFDPSVSSHYLVAIDDAWNAGMVQEARLSPMPR